MDPGGGSALVVERDGFLILDRLDELPDHGVGGLLHGKGRREGKAPDLPCRNHLGGETESAEKAAEGASGDFHVEILPAGVGHWWGEVLRGRRKLHLFGSGHGASG